MKKISICVIGSGSLATSLAKILAHNAVLLPHVEDRVNIFVYDELYNDVPLGDIINSRHVNEKYLPMIELPENLVACIDMVETAKLADVIVFAIPRHCILVTCNILMGKIKPNAMAISVIEGFSLKENGEIQLISQEIVKSLKIPCGVLMSVNLANEVALDRYCEATLGCRDLKNIKLYKDLFSAPKFRLTVIDDVECVEVCGFLKHMIAFASGLLDGLETNENTKSACLRFGLIEMIRFIDVFYPGCKLSTFFESCGIADVMTVCRSSRNRRLGEIVVKTGHTVVHLEKQLMGGEMILGTMTVKAVNYLIQQKGLQNKFPLFSTLYNICENKSKPEDLLNSIISNPNIIYHPTKLRPL
uniref:Glycerol-3-phosphate dehydrogenase [NAD(+)] n=1 Tax=Stomoxys calcitrans TaxID=35570 RepID=A0A1I8Q749_STOCA